MSHIADSSVLLLTFWPYDSWKTPLSSGLKARTSAGPANGFLTLRQGVVLRIKASFWE